MSRRCGRNSTVDLRKDPQGVFTPPLPLSEQPRVVNAVAPGGAVTVDLSKQFDLIGYAKNGASFGADQGFDEGGAAFSSDLLMALKPVDNVNFALKSAAGPNTISSKGQVVALPKGRFQSLHLLGAAVEGNQADQRLSVTYADGTTQTFAQNFSDWYTPGNFVGESRAAKMDYRNMGDGARDGAHILRLFLRVSARRHQGRGEFDFAR